MIQVTGCRLLIEPVELVEHDPAYKRAKDAGIALLEISERKEQINVDRGRVLQIGEMAHQDYIGVVKVGDLIGYSKFGGKFIKDTDDKTYLVINDQDVICIIKE